MLSVVFLFSCSNNEKLSENSEDSEEIAFEAERQIKDVFTGKITTKHLISLLENIDNEAYIKKKLDSLSFTKKFNGVYISIDVADIGEPKHWIYTNSSVSISTADEENWKSLVKELKKVSAPKSFDDGSSAKSLRYVGPNYTFESYEPQNGVNLSKNELYQVFVIKN